MSDERIVSRVRRDQPEEKKGSLYLLTGLVIGLIIGILFSKFITPVSYVETAPFLMDENSKSRYRVLVSLAYMADGDLGRARARLLLLEDEDMIQSLASQAQKVRAEDGSTSEAEALALLATDLRSGVAPVREQNFEPSVEPQETPQEEATQETNEDAFLPTSTLGLAQVIYTPTAAPSSTLTPNATFTPRPSTTPLVSIRSPFVLDEQETICDTTLPEGLLQVVVEDQDGSPVSGAQINITWNGGEENFFTGLYPQIHLGYADYLMTPELTYRLRVGDGGEVVDELIAPDCVSNEGETYMGGLSLIFNPQL